MRFRVAAILCMTLAACEQVATRQAEYRPQEAGTVDQAMCLLGFAAVPLRELVTGHHLVEATVNGRKGVFVLDTGANLTVLHAPVAKRFGIAQGTGLPAVAVGLGGGMRASQARLQSLRLGDVEIRQRRVMVADLSAMTGVLGTLSGAELAGIIGQDAMKEHRAVIDVARPIVYLIAADRDPAPIEPARCTAADTPAGQRTT